MAHTLILTPESELQFTLSASEETSKCTMTLRHPGTTDQHLAFKVKTTQPRRYLVRPNQGLVAPGSSEKVAIMLVEKDKNSLLQSYERLGQSALDHAKDKFLVQSCTVTDEFSSKYMDTKTKGSDNSQLYEALNTMWSSGSSKSMENKKLHVRLVVKDGNNSQGGGAAKSLTSAQASMLKPHETSQEDVENMTPPQLFAEISSLRKKYDELVSFSVNLTAERDILNNTLEQTKRELNKEMANRSALENKGAGGGGGGGAPAGGAGKGNFLFTLFTMLVVGAACFGAGVREAKLGKMDFIEEVPHIGEFFVPEAKPIPAKPATKRILDEDDD